ncbi:MAG: sporulation initiation factor Spo0A C-terminal domain-containing protein [Oscillospiraceae bacterium]|nr:sporulation initiation factor Spo0A C-terminal domain-containing protein [Oscillospiraceae bacterium]
MKANPIESPKDECKNILLELGFPVHCTGYKQLKVGIPQFALDDQQSLAYELYPFISQTLNCTQPSAVERSIGRSIARAWQYGSRDAWEKYFPGSRRAPTNKRFIATIAEYIK